MYAVLIPETINPNIVPKAHKNIFKSPSFSPETFSALRKHQMAPASAVSEIVPKSMKRMRSSFSKSVVKCHVNIRTGCIKFIPRFAFAGASY